MTSEPIPRENILEIFTGDVVVVSGQSLGADLRSVRKARGWTLETLATALDKSVGWLSQVERDISQPSMADIQAMAKLFDVPASLFFGSANAPEGESGRIVRADSRRVIGEDADGLTEALLSPDLTDSFEVIHSTFAPGAKRMTPMRRETQEVAYMISGRLDVWLDDDAFTIQAGDSFRIRGQSYRWANPYDTPAIAVWVISPPVY